ncbi:unnamed protein product [Cylicostephanus goldi]|uniref:DPH-type MB domain-containing protein n=1 Tax=Cylicostephanus goldi TaxID=71465 RepID=A0A3P7MZ94_CYLGO|nr:unnamed protein product [Cylicostephanus goldi]
MLEMGEDVATCPSCSLIIRVIYDPDMFVNMETSTMPPQQAVATEN